MPAANELRLDDGFPTYITFANIPTVKLYEKEVTPPGMTANGPIDTTTMRNTAWRTMAPKQLKTMPQISATVAYATDAIEVLYGQIGVNQPVTVTFPDGSSVSFWGWIEEFTPGANTEGEQPTASLTVQPSLRNADGTEVAPAYYGPDETSNPA
jgi:hypothetical protein